MASCLAVVRHNIVALRRLGNTDSSLNEALVVSLQDAALAGVDESQKSWTDIMRRITALYEESPRVLEAELAEILSLGGFWL